MEIIMYLMFRERLRSILMDHEILLVAKQYMVLLQKPYMVYGETYDIEALV